MPFVTSLDGTRIAYEKSGNGPALILVDGALCRRDMGPARPLAKLLTGHFTVYIYDRRGRGESSNTLPYSPVREIEDLDALIRQAGGAAFVYGISSGAALALDAAVRVPGMRKLVLYEAPFIVDASHSPLPVGFRAQLEAFVEAGRQGDAVKMFMRRVGVPAFGVFMMRLMPVWKKLTAVAHTLPYDFHFIEEFSAGKPLPQDRWSSVRIPVIVADGGKSPEYMRNGMRALAGVLPNAAYQTLTGQTHMVKPEAVAPMVRGFFRE